MKLSECNMCSLSKTRTNVVLPIINGISPIILFLGEAPGENEDKEGKPFVGRAGKWHWKIANYLGVKNSCIVMNTIQCRPIKKVGDKIKNGKPKNSQIEKCSIWLNNILKRYKPRLIVLYGTYPIKHVLGFSPPIKTYVGKFYEAEIDDKNYIVFAARHPATLCYDYNKNIGDWKKHLKLIRKFLYEN